MWEGGFSQYNKTNTISQAILALGIMCECLKDSSITRRTICLEYFDWYSSSDYLPQVLDATKLRETQPFSWRVTRTICLNILINFHFPTIYHNAWCHKAQKNLASFLALHFHSDVFPFKLEIGWKLGGSSYFHSSCILWMSLFIVLNIVLACFVVYLIISPFSFHFHSQSLNWKSFEDFKYFYRTTWLPNLLTSTCHKP